MGCELGVLLSRTAAGLPMTTDLVAVDSEYTRMAEPKLAPPSSLRFTRTSAIRRRHRQGCSTPDPRQGKIRVRGAMEREWLWGVSGCGE